MKTALITSLIAGIVMLLLACSGSDIIPPSPNPPLPGPPQGGGPILNLTDEQRIAVLNECGAVADALGDLKSDAAQQTLVTYLKSRAEFGDAGITSGNVWAYFHDGRIVAFIPDWLDKDSEIGGRVATPDISGGRNNPETNLRAGVPAGKKVMLFHGLGNAYQDNRPYLTNIFSSSHTQYTVESKDATIENLKSAKNVDVFFIDTHGGLGRLKAVTATPSVFILWTSDSLSVEREIRYKPDLDSTVLAYVYALEDLASSNRWTNEWHYGITPRFVFEHMSFTENSLLYIDACDSYTEDASAFKDMMMGVADNNAATYIGWTGLTDQGTGFPTSRFIFDRLLGAPVYMLESPAQRPFDLDPIVAELTNYNLGISRHGGMLDFESTLAEEIMLAPSIKYITMHDYISTMTIEGLFGDNSRNDGKVTVGGITVPFEWSPNSITCELPVTGPGSSGDVIVSVNGHESNKVPLTEWTIPLHLVRDDFGVEVDAKVNLKIRADVHRFREKIEEIPKTERPEGIPLPPGSLGVPFSLASTGTYNVGGQRTAQCVRAACTLRDTESIVSRNGYLPFSITEPGLAYSAFYKWSKDMKTLEVTVIVNIPNTGLEAETYTHCEDEDPETSTHSVTTTLGITTIKPLMFHLDANYNFQPGDIHETKNADWGRCQAPAYFQQSATWPEVRPTSAPKGDTEARYEGD